MVSRGRLSPFTREIAVTEILLGILIGILVTTLFAKL
jgi:type III secretory pathway component EscT